MLKLLIATGADLNKQQTPQVLRGFIRNGSLEVLKILYDSGVNLQIRLGGYSHNYSKPRPLVPVAFYIALAENKTEFVEFFLKRGLSPSAAQFPYGWWNGPEFNFVETPMQTPLQVAAFYGAQDSIKLLLKAGADINARPDWKVLIRRSEYNLPSRTPLHAAVMSFRNQSETPGVKPSLGFIKFLLSVGANPQLIDWNRETALDLAKRLKLPEVVKLLER